MNLLAGGISPENKITIIALCIGVIIFICMDVALLVSLHKRNKKFAEKRRALQEEKDKVNKEEQLTML